MGDGGGFGLCGCLSSSARDGNGRAGKKEWGTRGRVQRLKIGLTEFRGLGRALALALREKVRNDGNTRGG